MEYTNKTAKDKYDAIIKNIEKGVKNPDKNNKTIIKEAFNEGSAGHFEDRQQRSLISFMTNYALDEYIDRRRMMNIYEELIDRDKWEIDDLIYRTHLSQKAFIQSFKKIIGLTPTAAFKEKDKNRIQPPSTWDYISGERQNIYEKAIKEEDMTTTFGLIASPIQIAEASVAQNLENYYRLNRMEAELAFKIAKENSLGFEDTFRYVYNYIWKFIEKPEDCRSLRDEGLEDLLLSEEVIHLYFVANLSFSQIDDAFDAKIQEYIEEPLTTVSRESCLKGIHDYYKSMEQPDMEDEYDIGLEYEPDWDSVEEFYGSGMRSFCEEHMQDNGDVDMDDYEAQQDWVDVESPDYNECDFWEQDYNEFMDGYGTDLDFEADNVNDFDEFDDLCKTIDDIDDGFKGDLHRRLPKNMEKIVNYVTRQKRDLQMSINVAIGFYENTKCDDKNKNALIDDIKNDFKKYKKLCARDESSDKWQQKMQEWLKKQPRKNTTKREKLKFNTGDKVIINKIKIGKISEISGEVATLELTNGEKIEIDIEYLTSRDAIRKI